VSATFHDEFTETLIGLTIEPDCVKYSENVTFSSNFTSHCFFQKLLLKVY
jgi:hypothetical protein